MTVSKSIGLTGNKLKIIAMLSMLIDHVGVELFPGVIIFRIIGRLALPIFAYMIAEGCQYTRNRLRYLGTVAGLGLLCQAVFYAAERSLYMGILITFALSITFIFSVDFYIKRKTAASFTVAAAGVLFVLFAVFAAPAIFKTQGYCVDYGALGVFLPIAVYYVRGKAAKLTAAFTVLTVMAYFSGAVQWFALLAIPLLALYNGKRGKYNLKYMFYIFYPTHLAAIYLIGLLI